MRVVLVRALMGTVLWGGLGLFLSLVGCARDELAAPAANPTETQATAPPPAIAAQKPAPPSTPSVAPTAEQFRQAVLRRFDHTRITTQQLTPEGGVLHVPNEWTPHAMMMVRNADGTVSQRCVSSSAEAAALLDEGNAGGAP